jgi:peptidoglycan/xylan/chitin deacetylase (PgdA/CDA1 family)
MPLFGQIPGSFITDGTVAPADLTVSARASLAAADAAAPLSLLTLPGRLPQFPAASSVVTLGQASHGWVGSTGFVADDTTEFCVGTQSMAMPTAGTGATYKIEKTSLSVDTTGQQIRIRVHITNLAYLHTMKFLAGNASNYTDSYTWTIAEAALGSEAVTEGEWATITLPFSSATVSGSPTRSGITAMKLTVRDNNTAHSVTARLQSVELVAEPSSVFANGLVSITFDDGWATQWTLAKPILDAAGLKATLFNIQDKIGTAGRLTAAQCTTMQGQGHEICSHMATTAAHNSTWTGLTGAELTADINAQITAQRTNGWRGAGTAYPSGAHGVTTDSLSTLKYAQRFAYARTVCSRFMETFPPSDPHRLRAQSGISTYSGGYDPSLIYTDTTGLIDRAKDTKAWLILVFHGLTAGVPASTTEITTAAFQAIIDKIVSSGITCLPIGDALTYHAGATTPVDV